MPRGTAICFKMNIYMKVIVTPISKIKPYAKNAKKHPKKQIQQIANSLKTFGWAQPLVVDKNGVLIIGHGRLEAAKLLGMTDAPVITMGELTPQQVAALRLADNKLNESQWDMSLVLDELKELNAGGFDIDLTGFSKDLILDEDDKDDLAPELPEVAKSKVGELYQLGKHLLLCGDATSPEHLKRLMGGLQADMVFTDPPYNVNYKGTGKKTKNTIMNDKMTPEQFDKFLAGTFASYAIATKQGAGLYVFHSSTTQDAFRRAIEGSGLTVKQQLIWNKPAISMGWSDYRFKHEPFFYCSFKGKDPQWYGDKSQATVVDFHKSEEELIAWAKRMKRAETAGQTTIWSMKRDNTQEYVHPTQKPVELIVYAIANSSKEGDVVLDLFGGSGSTMIACEKSGRISRTMELDPKYVDVIIERWEGYTGEKAKKLK